MRYRTIPERDYRDNRQKPKHTAIADALIAIATIAVTGNEERAVPACTRFEHWTGPSTPEGLERSRRARWKHGARSLEMRQIRDQTRRCLHELRRMVDRFGF